MGNPNLEYGTYQEQQYDRNQNQRTYKQVRACLLYVTVYEVFCLNYPKFVRQSLILFLDLNEHQTHKGKISCNTLIHVNGSFALPKKLKHLMCDLTHHFFTNRWAAPLPWSLCCSPCCPLWWSTSGQTGSTDVQLRTWSQSSSWVSHTNFNSS